MRRILAALALAGAIALLCFDGVLIGRAFGRDMGQWIDDAGRIRAWFQNLKQPDNPTLSCCGEADAYYADDFAIEGERYVAIITDLRDDGPLMRPHREPGARFVVPNTKLKWDAGNPTGHGVIFIRVDGVVLCYVVPGGT